MCRLIQESRHTARKTHDCNACYWLEAALCDIIDRMTYAEKRAVVRAKLNHGRIQPGQVYILQTFEEGGDLDCVRSIPELHEICLKYDVYEGC